jgi:rhodanese-related sulfurtransferase
MPTIQAALEQLRAGEDITLVDVREPGQHVLVTKDGGSVVVDVTDKDETVRVSTPIRAIESTIEQVAAASSDSHD